MQLLTVSLARDEAFAKEGLEGAVTASIKFVGLFDPVVGFPFFFSRPNREKQLVRNRKVEGYVEINAIDERFILFPSHSGAEVSNAAPKRYTAQGVAMPTPELSTDDVVARKRLAQRAFVWLPGEHCDIGGQQGDPVIADHSLLTMIKYMFSFSGELNEALEINRERLKDSLNSIEMDAEVKIGRTRLRQILCWQRRKPGSTDTSLLHGFARDLDGRSDVFKALWPFYQKYRVPKAYSDLELEPSRYPRPC